MLRYRPRSTFSIKWIKPKYVTLTNKIKLARIKRRYSINIPMSTSVYSESQIQGQLFRRILRRPSVPKMEWGECECNESGWHRVYFKSKMKDPVVVGVAKVRGTTFIDRVIYRVTPNEEELNNRVKNYLGDWGVFNWIRDAVAGAITKILMFVWNVLIMPQIDKIQDRVNTVIRDLWAMLGIPMTEDYRGGLAITFLNIANVTDEYFDFLCLGNMDIMYLAVSKPE